jgi:hypothetical protein
MVENDDEFNIQNDDKSKKRLVQADRSLAAADTTERSDGKNYYCSKCGNYFYTAEERNNHGCPLN